MNELLEVNPNLSKICSEFLDIEIPSFLKEETLSNEKLIREVKNFQKQVGDLVQKVYNNRDVQDIKGFLIKNDFDKNFSQNEELISIWEELRNKHNKFPVFKFCAKVINLGIGFNETEHYIFNNYLNYYQEHTRATLEEIGEEVGLTRERVRQIRNNLIEEFNDKFQFIQPLSYSVDIENIYDLDFETGFIFISDSKVKEINNSEGTSFNTLFITKIFHLFCRNSYDFLGYELNFHSQQQRKKYLSLEYPYLFSKQLLNEFSPTKFIKDIKKRLSDDIKDSYTLNLRAYISRFTNSTDLDLISVLEKPCKIIINNEFELLINLNGEIIFERNKKKYNYEIIEEALEKLGYDKNGYHVTEINEKINELYPDIDYSDNLQALSGIINNYKAIFIHIGRSSTYALKKWERTFTEFKGGTIRDIIEEFLVKKDKPQHMSVITDHVNKYRDTTTQVIYSNLKLDDSKRFEFFGEGFLGLNDKDYKNEDTEFNNLNGFVFTKKRLEKYIPDYYDNVLRNISKDNEVLEVQVKSSLDNKIDKGDLVVNSNNIVRFNDEKS